MATKPAPKPAPPPSTTTQKAIAGTGGGGIDPVLSQQLQSTDPNVQKAALAQILAQTGAGGDPTAQATQQYLDSLGVPLVTPEMALHGQDAPPGDRLGAIAAWQSQLSAAGLLPSGYTRGYLDQPTINATYQVMAFGSANKLASPSEALNALHSSYQAVASASAGDPALTAAERALRRAQLPLDWADLQRRIKEQPLLDAELQRRIAGEAAIPKQEADKFQQEAHQTWWVPLSDSAALDWGKKVQAGTATEEDFTTWVRQQAAALYPQFASFINNGVEMKTLIDPYLSIAAKELDKTPDQLWGSQRVFGASFMAPDGSLPDTNTYLTKLRQLPEWRTTTSANELANDWSAKLAATFGGISGISTGPLTAP